MAASVAHYVLEQVFDSLADRITPEIALRIEKIHLGPHAQERINELAVKANSGTLTAEERTQYEDFIEAIDLLGIFKAKARWALSQSQQAVALGLVVIQARDLEAARQFYQCLGLDLQREQHGKGPEHLAVELGAAVFEVYPAGNGSTTGTIRIGFVVPLLEHAVVALRKHSAKILTEPHDSLWGRRAVV
jgi:lactoylglutathione lyase